MYVLIAERVWVIYLSGLLCRHIIDAMYGNENLVNALDLLFPIFKCNVMN